MTRMRKSPVKAGVEKKLKGRKPAEYRRFEGLLKQIVKAPPLRKVKEPNILKPQGTL
jgi:hypothetical protein